MSSSAASYRRVAQEEAAASSSPDGITTAGNDVSLEANVTRSRGERLQDKLIALAWVVLALLVSRWTSFLSNLWSAPEVNRLLLRLAGLGFGAVLAMILYLTVYLPRVKGLTDSTAWPIYCPNVLPSIAATGIMSYLLFLRATWPLWGVLAPLISGTQFMGILMALHFVPSMGLC